MTIRRQDGATVFWYAFKIGRVLDRLDDMERATLVGGRMAGLRGALGTIRLPKSGIGVNVPVERLSTVAGVPREDAAPDVVVPEGDEDAALAAAIRVLGGR